MDMMQKVVDRINRKAQSRDLFNELKVREFVRVDQYTTFNKTQPSPVLVFYKFINPLYSIPINLMGKTVALPIGRMGYLGSNTLHFGYFFEFPAHRVVSGSGYFGVSRIEEDIDYSTPAKVVVDANIIILAVKRDAILCLRHGTERWINRSGYHQKKD